MENTNTQTEIEVEPISVNDTESAATDTVLVEDDIVLDEKLTQTTIWNVLSVVELLLVGWFALVPIALSFLWRYTARGDVKTASDVQKIERLAKWTKFTVVVMGAIGVLECIAAIILVAYTATVTTTYSGLIL